MIHPFRLRAAAVAVAIAAVTMLLTLALPAAATSAPPGCKNRTSTTYTTLLDCVTLEGVRAHQAAFQAIADANGGNRFSGLSGYNASVDYVVETLEAAGYEPEVQEFDYLAYEVVGPSALQQTAPSRSPMSWASTSGRSPRPTPVTSPRRSRPSTCSSAWATPRPAGARLPTTRASLPGTSRCSSEAPAPSRSRPRTPLPPARSGS